MSATYMVYTKVPDPPLFVSGINILQHQRHHLHAAANDDLVCNIQVVKCKI